MEDDPWQPRTKFRPIEEKFLTPNQRFALGFGAPEGVGFVWLRVLGVEPTRMRPYRNNITPIAAGGTLEPVEPRDFTTGTGNKLLNVTSEMADRLLYHVGVGINPREWIRCYAQYPTGQYRGSIEDYNPISLGADYGWVDGFDSPYEAPTDALEFMFPFGMTAAFGFQNTDLDDTHQPVLSFEIRKYFIEVLSPIVPEHAEIIRRMALGQAPCYYHMLGPVESPVPYALRRYWNDVVPLTIEQARGLAGGGQ